MITLWCDMDGVLAVYEKEDYTGENPAFLVPGGAYFDRREADTTMIDTLELAKRIGCRICVITNIMEGPMFDEHVKDKKKWVNRFMPFVNTDLEFIATTMPKSRAAAPLSENDILVSDYNMDLIPWHEEGGTAVKYLNGINSSASWFGKKIWKRTKPEIILNDILPDSFPDKKKKLFDNITD